MPRPVCSEHPNGCVRRDGYYGRRMEYATLTGGPGKFVLREKVRTLVRLAEGRSYRAAAHGARMRVHSRLIRGLFTTTIVRLRTRQSSETAPKRRSADQDGATPSPLQTYCTRCQDSAPGCQRNVGRSRWAQRIFLRAGSGAPRQAAATLATARSAVSGQQEVDSMHSPILRRLVGLYLLAGAVALIAPGAALAAYPDVSSANASVISSSGATLSGTVSSNGEPGSYKFEYGTTLGYGSSTGQVSFSGSAQPVQISATLAHLSPDSTYYVRLVANNVQGTTFGAGSTFSTAPGPQPIVGVAAVTITAHTLLSGMVWPGDTAGSWKFEYGPASSEYSQSTPEIQFTATSALNAEEYISGLNPGTVYYVRLVANTKFGTTYGTGSRLASPSRAEPDRGCTTLPPQNLGAPTPRVRLPLPRRRDRSRDRLTRRTLPTPPRPLTLPRIRQ